MEASKNPDYLRALATAVTDFRSALEAFLAEHVVTGIWGVASPPP